jgi:hypothetical protein
MVPLTRQHHLACPVNRANIHMRSHHYISRTQGRSSRDWDPRRREPCSMGIFRPELRNASIHTLSRPRVLRSTPTPSQVPPRPNTTNPNPAFRPIQATRPTRTGPGICSRTRASSAGMPNRPFHPRILGSGPCRIRRRPALACRTLSSLAARSRPVLAILGMSHNLVTPDTR